MLELIEAWAIVDIQKVKGPFPGKARWTFAGEEGEKVGLMAIYDREPDIPEEWKDVKKAVRVFVSSCNDEYYRENDLVVLGPRSDEKKSFDILKKSSDFIKSFYGISARCMVTHSCRPHGMKYKDLFN